MQTDVLFARWVKAWPDTDARGVLKETPEDFVVIEQADHLAAAEADEVDGDHLYVLLQKRNQTTRELVRAVADANALPLSSIGYAGMKDKHAVTQQWVSVPVGPGEGTGTTDIAVPDEALEIARVRRPKKLRRGGHQGNQFSIRLRGFGADAQPALADRLRDIAEHGVPNYFAEQRFGTDNLTQAIAWLPRRRRERNAFRKGLHLSVLRSFLFNEVLSARVAADQWRAPMADETVAEGPLWGRGRVQACPQVIEFERDVLAEHMDIASELEFAGLKQERRALAVVPRSLQWTFEADAVCLEFGLPPGCYATSVLRELGVFERAQESAA